MVYASTIRENVPLEHDLLPLCLPTIHYIVGTWGLFLSSIRRHSLWEMLSWCKEMHKSKQTKKPHKTKLSTPGARPPSTLRSCLATNYLALLDSLSPSFYPWLDLPRWEEDLSALRQLVI